MECLYNVYTNNKTNKYVSSHATCKNFHPLEVVSRLSDPQLQMSENYSDVTKW